jgi:hypothetical protein
MWLTTTLSALTKNITLYINKQPMLLSLLSPKADHYSIENDNPAKTIDVTQSLFMKKIYPAKMSVVPHET